MQRDFSRLRIPWQFEPEGGTGRAAMIVGTDTSTMLFCEYLGVGESDTRSGATVVALIETDEQIVYVYIL